MSEQTRLIRAAKRGDQTAMRHLYDSHVGRAWRLALRLVQSESLAEDCVQEAFVKAFQRLEGLQDEAAFGGWLLRITYRTSVDRLRQEARHQHDPDQDVADSQAIPEPGLKERLVGALDELEDIYSEVLVLYHLLGHSHPEIARELNIPEGTSKRRLSIARSRLRATLSEYGDETTS